MSSCPTRCLAVLAAAVLAACSGDVPDPVSPGITDARTLSFARDKCSPWPECKNGDEEPDPGAATQLQLTEGMVGFGAVSVDKDNGKSLVVNGAFDVTLDMTGTQAAAVDAAKRADGDNGICRFDPAGMSDAEKQRLADGLTATHGAARMDIDKRAATGSIRFEADDALGTIWTSLGFNTGEGHVSVDYEGTDPNDASQPRHFRFATGAPGAGAIRLVIRLGSGPDDPIGDLTCFHIEEVLAVVTPG